MTEADSTWLTALRSLDNPFGTWCAPLGLELVEASPDILVVTWTPSDAVLQPFGIVHGGAHTSVTETLASLASVVWRVAQVEKDSPGTASASDPRTWPPIVGVSNQTDFYRPSKPGQQLRSTCTPIHRGRTQQVWSVETVDEQGKLVARGQLRVQNL